MKKILLTLLLLGSLYANANQMDMKSCEREEIGTRSRIYLCKDKQYVVQYRRIIKQEVKKMTLINQKGNAIVIIDNK
jgi:hypothetical protein